MSIQVKNLILAEKFKLLGDLTILDNPKKVWSARAYYKAADILSALDIPATTRKSVYRIDSMLHLANEEEWMLDTPLDVPLLDRAIRVP